MTGPNYHGRTHSPDGTDPIPGIGGDGIRFDTDNEGGWVYVVSNDSTDIDYGDFGVVFADTSEDGILLVAQDAGNTVQGRITINDSLIRISLTSSVAINLVRSGGAVQVALKTGNVLEVVDNGGNPIFRVDEDGDLHGKTGKDLTFDL